MWRTPRLYATILILSFTNPIFCEETIVSPLPTPQQSTSIPANIPKPENTPQMAFKAFTGKITKSKVRLRTMPNREAPIIREVAKDDLFLIIGESGDFYAIQPPKGTKSYIFRTFVLDNIVEGSRVNVRLEPDLEAPVIAQLNTGDRIEGVISSQNNKWLEIAPPSSTRFYIAKEFVQNLGGPDMLARLEKRGEEVNQYLQSAIEKSQFELQKPYEETHIDGIVDLLNTIIQKYPDYPQQVAQAKEVLKNVQDAYLQKKISHLENKTKAASENIAATNQQLKDEIKNQLDRLNALEEQLSKQSCASTIVMPLPTEIIYPVQEVSYDPITAKMSIWNETEEELFQCWVPST